jgi:hypothetical protein
MCNVNSVLDLYNQGEQKQEVSAVDTTYLLTNISHSVDYTFQVSASTMIGEGKRTKTVVASIQLKGTDIFLSFVIFFLFIYYHKRHFNHCVFF